MRPFFHLVLLLILSTRLQAQDDLVRQVTRDWLNSGAGLTANSNRVIPGIKGPEGKRLGTPYLDTTFRTGYVVFYDRLQLPDSPPASVLKEVPVRLDLSTNEVEIRTKNQGVRVASWGLVRAFGIRDAVGSDTSWFANIREYNPLTANPNVSTGFFEQVTVGRLSLLRHHFVYVKRANYNAALNVGSRDDELEKQAEWYVARGRRVEKLPSGRKALIGLMGDKAPEIEAYMKAKKPDLKSKDDLKAAFRYYNSL
ncbi:MAG: hypothetical protein H7Z72_17385 [Bacteroidetes bacterium]|nr:hypothetical protein [Fibrella sp.]